MPDLNPSRIRSDIGDMRHLYKARYMKQIETLQNELDRVKEEYARKLEALEVIEEDFSDVFVGLETYDVSPPDPGKLDSPPAKDAIRVLLWCSWNKGVEFDWSDVKNGLVSLFNGATDNQTTISQYLRYMARDGEIELIQTGSGQASSRFRNICDVARRNKFVEKIPEEYRSIRKTEPFSQQIEDL